MNPIERGMETIQNGSWNANPKSIFAIDAKVLSTPTERQAVLSAQNLSTATSVGIPYYVTAMDTELPSHDPQTETFLNEVFNDDTQITANDIDINLESIRQSFSQDVLNSISSYSVPSSPNIEHEYSIGVPFVEQQIHSPMIPNNSAYNVPIQPQLIRMILPAQTPPSPTGLPLKELIPIVKPNNPNQFAKPTQKFVWEWLCRIQLKEYFQDFIDNGFDDLETIADLSADEVKAVFHGSKFGHLKKLTKEIELLKLTLGSGPNTPSNVNSPQLQAHTFELEDVQIIASPSRHNHQPTKYTAKKTPASKKTVSVSPGPQSPLSSENEDISTPSTPGFGGYQSPNANNIPLAANEIIRSSSEEFSDPALRFDESDFSDIAEYIPHLGYKVVEPLENCVLLKWVAKGAKRKREDKSTCTQSFVENPLQFVHNKKLQPCPLVEVQAHAAAQLHSIKVTLWKCDIRQHNWKPTESITNGLSGDTVKEINSGSHGNLTVVSVSFDKVKLNPQPKEEKKGFLYCFKFALYANDKDDKPVFKVTSHMFTILSHNSQRLKSPQSLALMKVHPDFGQVKTQNSAVLFGHFPLIPDYRIQFDKYPAVINYSMNRPPTNVLSVFTPPVDVPSRVDIHMWAASYYLGLPNSYSFLKGSEFRKKVQQSGNPNNGNSPDGSSHGRNSHDDAGPRRPGANDPNNNNRGGNFYGGFQNGRSIGPNTSTGEYEPCDNADPNEANTKESSASSDSAESSSQESETSSSGRSSSRDKKNSDGSDDNQDPNKSNSAIISKLNPSNVNAVDAFGFSPLHKATCRKNTDLMLSLIGIGADVNLQDAEGYTPLMWSIAVEDLECAKMLLRFHGDPNIPDVYGLTPLHVAVGLPDPVAASFVSVLMRYQADPNAQDIYKETPIDFATELEKDDLLKILQGMLVEEPLPEPATVPAERPIESLKLVQEEAAVVAEVPAASLELLKSEFDPLNTPAREPIPELVLAAAVKEPLFSHQKQFLRKPHEYEVSLPTASFGINPEHYDSLTKLSISKCPNLRTLPYNIALCRRLDTIHVDWKVSPKIMDPPRDIIDKGAVAVRDYMSLVISGEATTKFYGRAKIIVLGPSLAGKTSLLKVLNALRMNAKSLSSLFFKPNPQDFAKLVSGGLRTLGVDVNNRETRFGDAESEFVTYDFGGEPEFASMYRHFISAENALYVITFDISADESGLHQQVKEWVELLKLYIPENNWRENKIRLLLVGNKVDKLVEPEIFRRLQFIRDRTEQVINGPVIGTSCLKLQFYMIDVDGTRRTGGFSELSSILASQARQVNAFAHIPQLFKTIQETVESFMEQPNSKDFFSKIKGFLSTAPEERINYIFSWNEFVTWCQSLGFDCDEKLLLEAANYLHTVGTAIVSRQTRAVCIDPRKFGKIVGAFLAEATKSKLQLLEKDYEISGILESKIVPAIFDKMLTSHGDFMVHADDSSFVLQVMENYDLCFRIPKTDNALFPSLRRPGKPAFPVILRNKTDRMETNTPDRIICFSLKLGCETGARSLFRMLQIGLARDFIFQSMYQDSIAVKDHKTDTWLLASLHRENVHVVIMGEQPSKMQYVTLEKIRHIRNDEMYSIVKLCPKCCFEDPMAIHANELLCHSVNQQKLLKCPVHGKLDDEPKRGYTIPDEIQSSANQFRSMEDQEISCWEFYTPSLQTNWDKWGNNTFRRMILKKPFPKRSADAQPEERYKEVMNSDIPEVERVEAAWKSMLGHRVGEFEITRITILENPQQERIFQERWIQLNTQGLPENSEADSRMQAFVSECSKLYNANSKHFSNANSFTSLKANLAVGWWNGKSSQFSVMADDPKEGIENSKLSGKGYHLRSYPLFTQESLGQQGYDTETVMLCWVMLGNSRTVEGSQQVPNTGTHDSIFRVFTENTESTGSHEITVFDKSAILPRYVVSYRLLNAVLWIDDHHQTNNEMSIQKLQEQGTHVFQVSSKEEALNWLNHKHNRERYKGLPGDRFRIICNKKLMVDPTNEENRLGANSLYAFIRSTWQHTPIMIYCGKYEDQLWKPETKLYITTGATNLENFALMEPLVSIKRFV